MRVLLNYEKIEKDHLSVMAHIFRSMGIDAVSTALTLTIGELIGKAKQAGCSAIVCNNSQTLRNLVPGENPTVDAWRGTRLNFDLPVIIINKIAHVHTVPYGRWLLEQDLNKLRKIHIPPVKFSYTKLLTKDMMQLAFSEMQRAVFTAYDVETKTYDPPKDSLEGGTTVITCASWTSAFEDGSMKTWVLPLIDYEGEHWKGVGEYEYAIKFLRKANALKIPKVMHNGMYDCTHSIRYHAHPESYILDTMGLAHSEYAELPKDLAFVASYRLYDYVYWKDDAESAAKKKDQEKYWAYNAKDTWNTARILVEQLRHAKPYTFRNYAEQFPLTFPSLYCNFEGARIDQEVRINKRTAASIKLDRARERLQTMFADPNFNPGSWQQVARYVYDVFGAKRPNIGKSKAGTDEKNLLVVGEQHPLLARITGEILDYKESQKAIGTYFDFLQWKGRLLWALDPFGAETGRFACKASSLWCGTQVQNVPGYAKQMIVADDGFEIFEADEKQAEGRTTAYCSQDEALIAALENAEKDFYKTLGTLFFNMPYEEVTDFFRNKVLKRIVHGTNYMMGAKTFIENIGARILFKVASEIGIEIVDVVRVNRPRQRTLRGFASDLLDLYHKPFKRVRPWYQEIKDEISATGYLVGPTGHTRKFFANPARDHNALRSAVAHQPQNLSGYVLNQGFKRFYKAAVLKYPEDIRLKAQIHDSIFGQWRITKRDFFAELLLECMYNPVMVHGRRMVIPVDLKHGLNWAEADENNPNGTVKYKRKSA